MENKGIKKRVAAVGAIVLFMVAIGLAQWGGSTNWLSVPSGSVYLNCPANSCSVTGQVLNFPGLSAYTQLTADQAATSSTTALANVTGMSFPIAASETGHLDCEVYFTNASGGGLDLTVNGPGTPTQVTERGSITVTNAAGAPLISQSALWQQVLAGGTSTVTTIQPAHIYATIENGATAGTLQLQFSDFNTTGPTTIKRGTWCTFP